MAGDMQIFSPSGEPELIAWFDDFDGPNSYSFLSNFYVGTPLYIPIVDDSFPTGEHAFQALKAVRGKDYEAIRSASDPHEAKRLGRNCRLRPDWEAIKYDAMMAVIRAKFTSRRDEGGLLLSTGDSLLIEGTYWGDTVWGVALRHENQPLYSPGRNWLGTMLMARRAELKAEEFFDHHHATGAYNAQFANGK